MGRACAQRPVSQEVLALAGDTDPITGLGGDGGSVHQRHPPTAPSQSCQGLQHPGARSADQWGKQRPCTSGSIASQPGGGAGWERLGSADGVGWGQLWWSQRSQGACVAWGVSWAHLSPGVDKGTAKGRVRVDRLIPRGDLEDKEQMASPPGSRATACGDGFDYSAQTSRQALPASLSRGGD